MVLFLTAILRTDKLLKMSVIHRAMQDCWRELADDLGAEVDRCVSYSQLKRIVRIMELIDQRGGAYLALVKGNQAVPLENCQLIHQHLPSGCCGEKTEKGYGRVETRRAWSYPLDKSSLAER